MSDSLVREPNDTAFLTELAWQRRLDALVSGECTVDQFLDELTELRDADPDAELDDAEAAQAHMRTNSHFGKIVMVT